MPHKNLVVLACLAALTVTLGGCPTQPIVVVPDLTADLQFLVDNAAALVPPAVDDLDPTPENVAAGGELDGCWGRTGTPTNNGRTVSIYELYQFDAGAGTVTYHSYLAEDDQQVYLELIGSGTFEVLSNGEVEIDLQTWLGNNPDTGALEPADEADPQLATPTIAINGDYMVLTTVDSGTELTFVYEKFACQD
jgi:hypothetical protein